MEAKKMKDFKTTMVGALMLIAFVACTVLLLTRKIDRDDYAVALSSMGAFGLSLIGWFAGDAKNK